MDTRHDNDGGVGLTGDPGYDLDELAECVDHFADFAARDHVDVEPLDERGADGEEVGRVRAGYAYEDTGTAGWKATTFAFTASNAADSAP